MLVLAVMLGAILGRFGWGIPAALYEYALIFEIDTRNHVPGYHRGLLHFLTSTDTESWTCGYGYSSRCAEKRPPASPVRMKGSVLPSSDEILSLSSSAADVQLLMQVMTLDARLGMVGHVLGVQGSIRALSAV
jgi:hypothetical protein